jgi:hypothetical protein
MSSTFPPPEGVKQSGKATFASEGPEEMSSTFPPPEGVKQSGKATFA